eukprot:365495-Chlamydomonas_euryale.AAC.16
MGSRREMERRWEREGARAPPRPPGHVTQPKHACGCNSIKAYMPVQVERTSAASLPTPGSRASAAGSPRSAGGAPDAALPLPHDSRMARSRVSYSSRDLSSARSHCAQAGVGRQIHSKTGEPQERDTAEKM